MKIYMIEKKKIRIVRSDVFRSNDLIENIQHIFY